MTAATVERILPFIPHGAIDLLPTLKDAEIVIEGPANCVAGETLFLDPTTGLETSIRRLQERGVRPIVQTLGGPVLAEVPFVKGYAKLYRVLLSSGLSILATGGHHVLTQSGQWRRVDALRAGDEVPSCGRSPLPSTRGGDPSVWPRDGHDSKQIREGWKDGYSHDPHQYGQPPQWSVDSDQVPVPSPAGAHARIRDDLDEDAVGGEPRYSRPGQQHALRASVGDSPLFGGTAQRVSTVELETPSRDVYSHRGAEPFQTATIPAQSTDEVLAPVTATLPVSFDSPYAYYRGQRDTVQSVTYERTDWYYDLHVPGVEHYFAQGFWHHNTGKTYGICHFLHRICLDNPGARCLMVRKTLVSLTDTALVTLREKVLTDGDPCTWFGGSRFEPASLRYDNGSRIVVGGMDNPSKFLSGEYDLAYVNECWELTLEDWETLTTRLRNGVLAHPRLIGDSNPTYERHWLYQREGIRWLRSVHADNPTVTEDYLENLRRLTGNRYQRFYLGQRVGIEGAIYAHALDEVRQFVALPEKITWSGRSAGGMDFGDVHRSAVVALTRDTQGRVWVRECWIGSGDKNAIIDAVRRQGRMYGIRQGHTDPNQSWAAQDLGWTLAQQGPARMARVNRVLGLLENDLLRFDAFGEGVAALWDEMHMYRAVWKETETQTKQEVVRKDDDRVAALEYAVEALEMAGAPMGTGLVAAAASRNAQPLYRGL